MRLDHFSVATQHLDCGFDRHHYQAESFSSASSSKTEQVLYSSNAKQMLSVELLPACSFPYAHIFDLSYFQRLTCVCHPQTLYPLSLISSSLDEAKTSLSTSSSAIGRNLTPHQTYTMVTGETLC